MDPVLVWEMGQIILKQLLPQILDEAKHIDTGKYTRIRFVLEFNINNQRGEIIDFGLEPRYRRDLKK